jgi:hypothetical protein
MSPFIAQLRFEAYMVSKISIGLAGALVLASVGIASARPAWETTSVFAPSVERYDGWAYPHSEEQYCYMPSSPCGNNHRVTN